MRERDLHVAIQNALTGSGLFQPGSVTINDSRVVDGSSARGPFAIVQSADTVETLPLASGSLVYDVYITLYQNWRDWQSSMDAFSDVRDGVLAALVAAGKSTLVLLALRTATPIEYQYQNYVDSAELREAQPRYVRQTLAARVH